MSLWQVWAKFINNQTEINQWQKKKKSHFLLVNKNDLLLFSFSSEYGITDMMNNVGTETIRYDVYSKIFQQLKQFDLSQLLLGQLWDSFPML